MNVNGIETVNADTVNQNIYITNNHYTINGYPPNQAMQYHHGSNPHTPTVIVNNLSSPSSAMSPSFHDFNQSQSIESNSSHISRAVSPKTWKTSKTTQSLNHGAVGIESNRPQFPQQSHTVFDEQHHKLRITHFVPVIGMIETEPQQSLETQDIPYGVGINRISWNVPHLDDIEKQQHDHNEGIDGVPQVNSNNNVEMKHIQSDESDDNDSDSKCNNEYQHTQMTLLFATCSKEYIKDKILKKQTSFSMKTSNNAFVELRNNGVVVIYCGNMYIMETCKVCLQDVKKMRRNNHSKRHINNYCNLTAKGELRTYK